MADRIVFTIKNSIRKSLVIGMSLLMFLMTGCSALQTPWKIVFTTGFAKDEVFRIEDSVCKLSEMMVYLINTQNGYENSLGAEIWQAQTINGTVEEQLKESVLAKVAQIKAMNLLAAEMGIELSQEEIDKAQSAAKEYYETLTESDIEAMSGADENTIFGIYSEYALADKLYDYIIRDINPEISDDEARTITVEQIVIKTFKLDASGARIPFNESEKSAALAKAKSIKTQLIDGASFDELVSKYNEMEETTLSFGQGEMEEAYEQAAFNLGKEEISKIIETSYGYVILKCITTFNRAETEYNKIRIVEERKRQVFGQQYDAFVDTLTKELNEELWESITVASDDSATAAGLWDVYNEFF